MRMNGAIPAARLTCTTGMNKLDRVNHRSRISSISLSNTTPMAQQPRRRIPEIQFRVLIMGRANAGKTTTLRTICDRTKSAIISQGIEKAKLDPSLNRGEHDINDELVFSNILGYIFHDSRGIESGGTEELEVVKEFIKGKCKERRLEDRLHAIWYCVPMDGRRPKLNLKFFKDICPDPKVPVIVVFTKYNQFYNNVKIDVSDEPHKYPGRKASEVAEERFKDHYLRPLGDNVKYVRLEGRFGIKW
ncbi:hypothetical protein EI94DRAFT_785377 [Lactarius quietus]|nr:hypothetical protein EI94DRAFT_785377 [Lactarius quietus]